ncbi:MAG: hypothetical protein GY778_11260, partial [bacterium]|nr:hypothetical protein [bacterium]
GTIQVPTLRLNTLVMTRPFERPDWTSALAGLPEDVQQRWLALAARIPVGAAARDLHTFAEWSLFLIGRLENRGVPIGAGTDTPIGLAIPGYSLHTELELLVSAKPSKKIEVKGRMKARFNQNFWTNFGGFGGGGAGEIGSGDCASGDCGEFDSRSAQYIKFRGLSIYITPGYKWVDTVTIGSSDFGMFDPFTIGKIRYIDRDNGSGLIFQGGAKNRKFTYDFARVSLPRLWAGPDFGTGNYNVQDAAYALQAKLKPNPDFDLALIYEWVNDIEIDPNENDFADGRDTVSRYDNKIVGLRFGWRGPVDIKGRFYSSDSDAAPGFSSGSFFGISGFSPVPAGQHSGEAYTFDVAWNASSNLGLNLQYFDIGAEFVSVMAARRESDVLLTEGHDGAYGLPGPDNSAFGVFVGTLNEDIPNN